MHMQQRLTAVPDHTQHLLDVLPIAGHTYSRQHQQQQLRNVAVGSGSMSSNSGSQLFLLTHSVGATS
jgi:hypothetical protein